MDEFGTGEYNTQYYVQKTYVKPFILMLVIMVLVTKPFANPVF